MLLVVLVAGCRGTAVAPAPDPATPVPVVFGSTANLRTDPFELNSAEVAGNILTVSVSFTGGCRYHLFVVTAAR